MNSIIPKIWGGENNSNVKNINYLYLKNRHNVNTESEKNKR